MSGLDSSWFERVKGRMAQRDRAIYGDTEVSITRNTCHLLKCCDEGVVTIHPARTTVMPLIFPHSLFWYVSFNMIRSKQEKVFHHLHGYTSTNAAISYVGPPLTLILHHTTNTISLNINSSMSAYYTFKINSSLVNIVYKLTKTQL